MRLPCLLMWNDERDLEVWYDAGFEGIDFTVGTYLVEVGSFAEAYAGPYELRIEAAESD